MPLLEFLQYRKPWWRQMNKMKVNRSRTASYLTDVFFGEVVVVVAAAVVWSGAS